MKGKDKDNKDDGKEIKKMRWDCNGRGSIGKYEMVKNIKYTKIYSIKYSIK